MFQVSSQIEAIATRSDNSIKITLGTQELPPEQAVEVFKLKGKQGWFLFSENELTQKDIPAEPAPEFKEDISPSQRQRSILYVIWQKEGAKGTFIEFYNKKMEQIAQWLKEKYLL